MAKKKKKILDLGNLDFLLEGFMDKVLGCFCLLVTKESPSKSGLNYKAHLTFSYNKKFSSRKILEFISVGLWVSFPP